MLTLVLALILHAYTKCPLYLIYSQLLQTCAAIEHDLPLCVFIKWVYISDLNFVFKMPHAWTAFCTHYQ